MKILLSIKPEYANKIFNGSKKYEFRKVIFKNPEVKTVVVYSSSPVQKVIGEFEIEYILTEKPRKLWQKTQEHSGISKEFFFTYFEGRIHGYAIKIKKAKRYKKPLCIRSDFDAIPPQSFLYL